MSPTKKRTILSISRPKQCLGKYFLPKTACNKLMIPHSIQNNGILDFISSGYQTILHRRFDEGSNRKCELNGFERLGRQQATTFGGGMCGNHDKELFRCIEDCEIDLDNGKQLLTFAIRSYLKEKYNKKYFSNILNSQTKDITYWHIGSTQAEKVLQEAGSKLNKIYKQGEYKKFKTVQFIFNDAFKIAASSIISPYFGFCGESINAIDTEVLPNKIMFVNIFPNVKNNKTYILIGFFKKDQVLFKKSMDYLKRLDEPSLKKAISGLLICYCQNIVINENILADTNLLKNINKVSEDISLCNCCDIENPHYLKDISKGNINLFSEITLKKNIENVYQNDPK